MKTIIGIDFDNTIVSYDDVFHAAALDNNLIPIEIEKKKESVRDYLRKMDQENIWTELQGHVYGTKMREAHMFSGVQEFLMLAVRNEFQVYIISHKTLHPYLGPQYDLHRAALDWLDYNGFFDLKSVGLSVDNVFFETSIDNKIKRISAQRCEYFIDDLPEVLNQKNFPEKVNKILFYPNASASVSDSDRDYIVCNSWLDISIYLLNQKDQNA